MICTTTSERLAYDLKFANRKKWLRPYNDVLWTEKKNGRIFFIVFVVWAFIVETGIAQLQSLIAQIDEWIAWFLFFKSFTNNSNIEQPLCRISLSRKLFSFTHQLACSAPIVSRQRELQVSMMIFRLYDFASDSYFSIVSIWMPCYCIASHALLLTGSGDSLLYASMRVWVGEWYRASVHQVTSHEVNNANVNYNYSGLTQMTDLHLTQFIVG